jgi:hypothetical protein
MVYYMSPTFALFLLHNGKLCYAFSEKFNDGSPIFEEKNPMSFSRSIPDLIFRCFSMSSLSHSLQLVKCTSLHHTTVYTYLARTIGWSGLHCLGSKTIEIERILTSSLWPISVSILLICCLVGLPKTPSLWLKVRNRCCLRSNINRYFHSMIMHGICPIL